MAETKERRSAKAAKLHRQADQDPVGVMSPVADPAAASKPGLPAKKVGELLLPQHKKLIDESGITPQIAMARGYESVTTKSRLLELGFAQKQCNVPALHIPMYDVHGEVAGRQIRPDTPRIVNGKPLKYESPKGTGAILDIPPSVRSKLGDPKIPLFITEGVRKADSAASHEIACIALAGVWAWRGKNSDGGLTVLVAWESIALNDRDVYIAFDSDVMVKDQVRLALVRLAAFLNSRGARVKYVYLPCGADGSKVGLDDYLAAGKTVADLLKLASTEVPAKGASSSEPDMVKTDYAAFEQGLARVEYDEGGGRIYVQLTNFTAAIRTNVIEDDGISTTATYQIDVSKAGSTRTVRVPASEFSTMSWATDKLGSSYVLMAGFGCREHARAAIQSLSPTPTTHTEYLHTGWRKNVAGLDGWAYLHGGGAIGARGGEPGVSVRLPEFLSAFVLPRPPEGHALRDAVLAVLRLIQLAAPRIVWPIVAGVFRCVLARTDFSIHLAAITGAFKTELAALAQSFFGAGFNARNLPGAWSSTGNALEAIAFIMKDALCCVDDYVPQGGSYDLSRLHRESDRVLRAQGNSAGRQRLNADGTLRPTKSPRGMILSTGEDTPPGQSLRARVLLIELAPDGITSQGLTNCQRDSRAGRYAEAMAGFLMYSAPTHDGVEERIRDRVEAMRIELAGQCTSAHKRTPDIATNLIVGAEEFIDFAVASRAISCEEGQRLLAGARSGILEACDAQAAIQLDSDPVERFVSLLRSALVAGQAHVVDENGQMPTVLAPEALGWHRQDSGGFGDQARRVARGCGLGWVIGSDLFLDPGAAFLAVQSMAIHDTRLAISERTLWKRISERGYLVREEKARQRHTVRKSIGGSVHTVLHLRVSLLGELSNPSKASTDGLQDGAGPGFTVDSVDDRDGDQPECDRPTLSDREGVWPDWPNWTDPAETPSGRNARDGAPASRNGDLAGQDLGIPPQHDGGAVWRSVMDNREVDL